MSKTKLLKKTPFSPIINEKGEMFIMAETQEMVTLVPWTLISQIINICIFIVPLVILFICIRSISKNSKKKRIQELKEENNQLREENEMLKAGHY